MTKKDTENAVYIAIISGAIGLLWDMLMNPCGKHWIPFFNSPSIDVACILKKGGLRLLPPIPPLGRSGAGSRYRSRADDLDKLRKDDDDDDDDDKGSGSGGSTRPRNDGGSGSGGTTRRYKELTALSDLDEYKERRSRGSRYKELTALADEDEMDRYKERRRANAPTTNTLADLMDRGIVQSLEDLMEKNTDKGDEKPFDPLGNMFDALNGLGKWLGETAGRNLAEMTRPGAGIRTGGIRPIIPII